MRLVVQRVWRASVTVDGRVTGAIGRGLVVFVAVAAGEADAAASKAADKVWNLRVFDGESAAALGLEVLVVSQFTLLADTSRGRRPYYGGAATPEEARPAIASLCRALRSLGATVAEGVFGAHMDVALVNDGPVTIILDV